VSSGIQRRRLRRAATGAYNDAAQTGDGLPNGVSTTPLPGWTPGATTWHDVKVTRAQVSNWFNWYIQEVAGAAIWQIELVRALGYQGRFVLPLAGRGTLPADLDLALTARLNGTADRDGSLEGGLFYPTQLRLIAAAVGTDLVSADVTGLDDATAVDARELSPQQDSCQASDITVDLKTMKGAEKWSSSRWTIANARQAGLDVVGENPGSPDAPGTGGNADSDDLRAQMQHAPRYAAECGLSGFYWAFEDDLFGDPKDLSLADYIGAIRESTNL
jgi:hypothetical protein